MIASHLRHALRALRHAPAFTATTVVSVGLAVGLACTVFVVAQAMLFAVPPYRSPETLVEIWPTESPASAQPVDYLTVDRALEWVGSDFRHVEGFAGRGMAGPLILRGADGAVRVASEPILGDWFGTVGAVAARGRTLGPADLAPGAPRAVVVSEELWRTSLSGSVDALGETLVLSGASYTLVGVMPARFDGDVKAWVAAASLPVGQRPAAYGGVARLRPGSTVAEAASEVAQLAAAQVAEDPTPYAGHGATALPLGGFGAGPSQTLWILVAVSIGVVLVGLSNLTHLFLVRAQRRSASLAVRASLGASTAQIGAGLLAEALVVATTGGVLGLILSYWGPAALGALIPDVRPPGDPRPGLGALGLTVGLTLGIAALVGLEPMRRLASLDLRALLQRGSGGAMAAPGERRTRNVLVATQIAVSVVLLTGAAILGLAWRSFGDVDPGYQAEQLVLARPDWDLVGTDHGRQRSLARAVADRLGRRPEVAGVAVWRQVGLDYPARPEWRAVPDGTPREFGPREVLGATYEVEPGTIEALGVPLVQGRYIDGADDARTPLVAVVTRTAADLWWPGDDALGHQVKLGQDAAWMTVVGVVEDFEPLNPLGRFTATRDWTLPAMFTAARQDPGVPVGWHGQGNCAGCDGIVIGVRAAGSTAAAASALREEIAGIDPDLPMLTLETLFESQMSGYPREVILVPGRLVGAGVAVALALALVGLVGIVAEGVSRRTREIGVRVALGADAPRLLATIARESVLTSGVGLSIGLVVAVIVHRATAGTLFNYMALRVGADTLRPALVLGIATVVLATSASVALLAARRALSVNPVDALRAE